MAQQTLFCLDLFPFSFFFYLTVDGPRYADIYYLLWTRLLTISGSFQAFNNHRRYKNQQAFAVWSEHKIKSTGEAHFANDSSVPSNAPVSLCNESACTIQPRLLFIQPRASLCVGKRWEYEGSDKKTFSKWSSAYGTFMHCMKYKVWVDDTDTVLWSTIKK